MKGPYSTYFDNLFLALRMARPDYKAQALHCLRAIREAALGKLFDPLLAALEAAANDFDENLTDSTESTAGGTGAYHQARTEWLLFVDDTLKDHVTPKLRKLPVYADFKKYGKSKLAKRQQPELLTESAALLKLYAAHQDKLYPTLAKEAAAKLQALTDVDETRDEQDAGIDIARLNLAGDRAAIARAQRRLKAQLELAFEDEERVYKFFDFSASKAAKKRRPKTQAPA